MTKLYFHTVLDQKPELVNPSSKLVSDAAKKAIETIDAGVAFYLSQLTQLETKLYEVKYRNIIYQDFIPVDTSGPDWIDSFSYISFDAVTMGKFIGANPTDIPRAQIDRAITNVPLFLGGIGYTYSLDELRKSQAMGQSLDSAQAMAANRGFQEHAQKVAFSGDATRNITGLFNNANISITAAAGLWTALTNDQIVDSMNDLLIEVWSNSANVHVPNVLLLPSDRWSLISSRRMADGTDTTILEYYRKNNLYTQITGGELTIKPILELQTAGAAGVHRMMAYELNDENLTMRMPMSLRFVPPQPNGLAIDVDGEYKFGGVEFRYPGSAGYVDGI